MNREKFEKNIGPYLFVVPFLVLFFMFVLIPIGMSIVISFMDWDYTSAPIWVGFKNFALIFDFSSFTGSMFWKSVGHTLLFVLVEAPLLIVLPFLIAVLLNFKAKGSKLARAIIYFPAILSITTVSIIFFVLLDTNAGIINKLFGVTVSWLTHQPEQWLSIFLLSTWWGLGGNLVLYTAGMQNISKDLYEAAAMDGCNRIQSMIYITLPCLRETFLYVIVMTILSCFNVMGQPMMLTAGEESTTVAMQFIYTVAFGGWKLGRASAMSLIMAIIMGGFSIFAFKAVIRKREKNA